MKKTLLISALFIVAALTVVGQGKQQARLLRNAYRTHSETQLYEFLDNWSDEVQSNENEANDPYVAEAHKVFAAFYQPLQLEMFGHRPDYYSYEDVPYFIVQGDLVEIGEVEYIPYKPEEIDSFLMVLIDRKFDDESERKEWKQSCGVGNAFHHAAGLCQGQKPLPSGISLEGGPYSPRSLGRVLAL